MCHSLRGEEGGERGTREVIKQICPVRREEGEERGTLDMIELIYPVRGEEGGERGTQEVIEQVCPVQGEEGGEQEVSAAVRLLLLTPLLAETLEGAGTGTTGDLEEEGLDQGHICLTVEHHLTLVQSM